MRTLRTVLAGAGLALTGYGLYGLLTDPYIRHPSDVLTWAAGAVVLHDGLWVPLLCLLGALPARAALDRRAPDLTTPVRTCLIVAAAVTAVALPAVLRSGADRGNPSVLALPYLRNWLLVLAAIAVVAVLWTALASVARSARRTGRRGRSDG
ncbi:hypothetical protein [Kitasatospora sp. NPDC057015]|uniref:hypothetical protein n=1 Tax=Kitasatospora sp. NPDC057015 TaxID=3346001 RepID=UPI00363B7B05